MSILPVYRNGRVCVPWWYGLGYPAVYGTIGLCIGIRYGDTMIISTESAIAMVICAFVGAFFYTVLYAVSQYNTQKAQAAELKSKIAQSGRDPSDYANMTAAEKWDIQKVSKFDRIFLIAGIIQIILGTALAVCLVYFYGSRVLIDTWEQYAVFSLVVGLISAWFLGETAIKAASNGEWQAKAAKAFQDVREIVEESIADGTITRKQELIKKFLEQGFSKKEAAELAKEAILKELND